LLAKTTALTKETANTKVVSYSGFLALIAVEILFIGLLANNYG
jgi:hypothetical protein